MLTCIEIRGLQVFGRHGWFEEERTLGQQFSIDIDAQLRAVGSHRDDDLKSSVRYDAVVDTAVRFVSGPSFATVEALAEGLAETLLRQYELIEVISVAIAKLRPPISSPISTIGVRVRLAREELDSARPRGLMP